MSDSRNESTTPEAKGNTERWVQLCEKASIEQDPDKLLKMVEEINAILGENERRLATLRRSHRS